MADKNDIALVVVDAIPPDIDDNDDIALANIQRLVQSGIAGIVYEFFTYRPTLGIDDPAIKRQKIKGNDEDYALDGITSDMIIAGGSLGNKHYQAFVSIMAQIRKASRPSSIHIPIDCTCSFENKYDSGESWADGSIGSLDMEVLQKYHEALARAAPPAYVSMVDGKVSLVSDVTTWHLWSDQSKMIAYLASAPKR